MNRPIRNIVVIGSGVMGSSIACHFANIGCAVLLLDIAPSERTEEEKKQGLDIHSPRVKNRIVKTSFYRTIKTKPNPLFVREGERKVTLGTIEEDIKKIYDYDWIVEAIVENLEIKKKLYEKIDQHRRAQSLVTTNTSGIPIQQLIEGRSKDFKKHFCGVHFFNPPRYLKLLEIIPSTETDDEVVQFLMKYGDLYLGKKTVKCKDTPAFIGNRIGIWSMLKGIRAMKTYQLSVDEIDKLTGSAIGRPKSATFRTSDIVGLDTFIKVAQNLQEAVSDSKEKHMFGLPEEIITLEKRGWLGEKTGQGFYKKTKNHQGKTEILTLDFDTFQYKPKTSIKFPSLEIAKSIDSLKEKMNILLAASDKTGAFYRDVFYELFQYVSFRIPEISDTIFAIDAAVCAGFGWQRGPFETWDTLGVSQCVKAMEKAGHPPNQWVYDMIEEGINTFYQTKKNQEECYDVTHKSYQPIPALQDLIILKNHNEKIVWHNDETEVKDIGDDIINFSWYSKSFTLGATVIEGMDKAISLAEKNHKGLVIGHQGADFSLGANLGLLFMYAAEQDYEEIEMLVQAFQHTVMRIRYSSIPVVVAPHGRTLGGGCEVVMHADRAQAAAETYIGLVETGVGLIPAGGGLKEFVKRNSESYQQGDVELNTLQNAFMNIAMATVSLSAAEAKQKGLLTSKDNITMNTDRQLLDAKNTALQLAERGYTQPVPTKTIKVQGRTGLAMFMAGINGMKTGRHISGHDAKIATKIAHVMCGGDVTSPQQVDEQYLLDLEREAFVSLCGEQKTLQRMESVLNGKGILRN